MIHIQYIIKLKENLPFLFSEILSQIAVCWIFLTFILALLIRNKTKAVDECKKRKIIKIAKLLTYALIIPTAILFIQFFFLNERNVTLQIYFDFLGIVVVSAVLYLMYLELKDRIFLKRK